MLRRVACLTNRYEWHTIDRDVAKFANRSESVSLSEDQCDSRGRSARELTRFLDGVIEVGGGPRRVAQALVGLGFPYSEGAVRAWRGSRKPPAEVLFALAQHFNVSLDDYAFASTMREQLAALEARVAALEAGAA